VTLCDEREGSLGAAANRLYGLLDLVMPWMANRPRDRLRKVAMTRGPLPR
jgi:hypothetical protein